MGTVQRRYEAGAALIPYPLQAKGRVGGEHHDLGLGVLPLGCTIFSKGGDPLVAWIGGIPKRIFREGGWIVGMYALFRVDVLQWIVYACRGYILAGFACLCLLGGCHGSPKGHIGLYSEFIELISYQGWEIKIV